MSLASDEPPLNPAQEEVLDHLRVPTQARPEFEPSLRHELHAMLEDGLAPVVERLPDGEDLFITKHQLAAIHGCEARHLAEEAQGFTWSAPLARGTVVHKAIELSVHWRAEPVPLALVDEALARLEEDDKGISEFLQGCTEVEWAELRALAGDSVTKFLECFPPLRRSWRPVTEARVRHELCHDRVTLLGKPDLALGQPQGPTAGKVLIDLKTGGFSPSHVDDLRFYALVETLRVGVPPMKLASYYLDACRPHPEPVTVGLLEAAAQRVIAGADRLVALEHERAAPVKRTGPPCRWCLLRDDCAEGRAYLADGHDDGSILDDAFELD